MIEIIKDDLVEGKLYEFDLDGTPILVAKVNGRVHAMAGRCTHLGCRLVEGQLKGTIVTCPCHGTKFEMSTGEVVKPLTKWPGLLAGALSIFVRDAKTFKVRDSGSKVFIGENEEE